MFWIYGKPKTNIRANSKRTQNEPKMKFAHIFIPVYSIYSFPYIPALQRTTVQRTTWRSDVTWRDLPGRIERHYIVVLRITTYYNVFQRSTTYYNVLQRTTKYHNVLQHITMYNNVRQRITAHYYVLQRTTKYYNVLKRTTTYYNVLQRISTS